MPSFELVPVAGSMPWPLTHDTGILSANCKRGMGVSVPIKSPVSSFSITRVVRTLSQGAAGSAQVAPLARASSQLPHFERAEAVVGHRARALHTILTVGARAARAQVVVRACGGIEALQCEVA